MKRAEYLDYLSESYTLIKVLSNKNDSTTLLYRNKALDKPLIVHSFGKVYEIFKVLNGIKCENLPEIYDSIELEDGQLVLEEYIDGLTVAEVMETGRYHVSGAKKVITEVSKALSVLHQRGFVHRDVKPENVVISKDGRTVLIDFNISRIVKNAPKDTVVMGTVGYAAPEQLGLTETDSRADIYSLGVLLNVMLTGEHPSKRKAKGRLGRIVKKCTETSPDDRYQSVKELINNL